MSKGEKKTKKLSKSEYEKELEKLQIELVAMQEWMSNPGPRSW